MALKPGSDAESPAAIDDTEVDPAATQPELEQSDVTTQPDAKATDAEVAAPPEPDKGTETEAAPDKAPKPTEAKKPTAVEKAIEHLTTPPKAEDAANPAGKTGDPATTKPKANAEKAPETAAPDASKLNDENADDALKDWSPEERKHTKGKVKERFRTLHDELEAAKPYAEIGQSWSKFVADEALAPDLKTLPDDGLSVAIKTQAAVIRVAQASKAKQPIGDDDLRLLQLNRAALDRVLASAGHASEAPAEDLSKVEITTEVRELKDAYGILKSDDELRAVQAALNRVRGAKAPKAAEKPEQTPPPARTAREEAPPARTATPSVPWTQEDVRLAQVGMRDDLVKAGIAADAVDAHYQSKLMPLLANKLRSTYPEMQPAQVWERLSPTNRRELVREAQSQWTAANPPKPAPPVNNPALKRAPTPPPLQGSGNRPAMTSRAGSGKGATESAIAYMSGEE